MTRERSGMAARARRSREANRWYVDRESGRELSRAQRLKWDRWIAVADNKAEYDEICELREQLRRFPCPPLPSDEELKSDSVRVAPGLADAPARNTTVVDFSTRARLRPKLNRASVSTVVAILVLAVGGIMIAFGYWPFWRQSESWQTYATEAAQQRDVVLPDGSVVTLGGDTVLKAPVAARSRAATLVRGEALFRVKRNVQQPFTVHAGNGNIEAIGTVFDVRSYSSRVQVAVTEGLVKVASQPRDVPIVDRWFSFAKKSRSVRVAQGQLVSYRMDTFPSEPQVTDPMVATAWTRGLLIYSRKPLYEIIEDVQRYYSRPIVLDQRVANLNYTGTFLYENADSWLHGLQLIFPVEVHSLDSKVVIRPRRSPGE